MYNFVKRFKLEVNFDVLPTEIIYYICQKLKYKDLLHLSLTCKKNKELIDIILSKRSEKLKIFGTDYEKFNLNNRKIHYCFNLGCLKQDLPYFFVEKVIEVSIFLLDTNFKLIPNFFNATRLNLLVSNNELIELFGLRKLNHLSIHWNSNLDEYFFVNLNKFMINHKSIKTLELMFFKEDFSKINLKNVLINFQIENLTIQGINLNKSIDMLKHIQKNSNFKVFKFKTKHNKFIDLKILNEFKCPVRISIELFFVFSDNIIEKMINEINSINNLITLKFIYKRAEITEKLTNWKNLIKLHVFSLGLNSLYSILKNKKKLKVLKCQNILLKKNQILDFFVLEKLCSDRNDKLILFLNEEAVINMKNNLELNETKLHVKILKKEKIFVRKGHLEKIV